MTTKNYPQDPIDKLYKVVVDKGYYTKTVNDFKAKYNTPESVDALYDVISKEKLFTKPKDDFYKQYFPSVSATVKKKEGGGVSRTVSALKEESKAAESFPLSYKRDKVEPMAADIRTGRQKAESNPQQVIKAGFTQSVSTKKDETFKVEMTDKEAQEKAFESFQSGEHSVSANSADPVAELSSQINIKKYSYTEYKVARKKIELLNNNFFPTGEDAKLYLQDNRLMPDNNATKQLAIKRYGEFKKVEDAVSESNSLEEAAVKLAAINGDEQVKYLLEKTGGNLIGFTDETSPIPMAMRGEKLLQLMMNRDFRELAEKNPQLKQSLKEEEFNFPVRHPEYATKLLVDAIASKRDKKGLNSSFANIVSKEATDKIVDELIEEGTMPSNYKLLYQRTVRPKLGTWKSIGRGIGNAIPGVNQLVNEAPIPTPGILENFEQGFENFQVGTAKSIVNLPSLAGLPTITDALQPREQQTFNVLKKQYETPQFEPSSLTQKVTMHGGQMAAFVTGLAGGTAALKALNLVKSPGLANATMMALATLGDTQDKAMALFPRNEFKQMLYIDAMTGLNSAMGRFLPGQQIPRLLTKGEGTVAEILTKMVDGKITTSAAKNQIMEWFGNTAKSTLGGAEFMAAISAADDALTQTLEGKNFNFDQTLEAGWEGFKMGLIATPVLGGFEAALKSNKGFREQIVSMAENAEFYKQLAEVEAVKNPEFAKIKDDVVSNIDYAANVIKDLEQYNLPEKEKQKYVLNSISELIKQKKAESSTDPTVKKKFQQEAKDVGEIKQAALRGIPEEKVKLDHAVRDVSELYDYDVLSKAQKEMLESKATADSDGKFDDKKVKPFLKFVAQQANNVMEDGKFNTAVDVRKDIKFNEQLIELANELFPEYKKTAEDYDIEKGMETAEVVNQQAGSPISVIMPGEIKQAEVTTISPKENIPEVKPKISIILPKQNEKTETPEVSIKAETTGGTPTEINQTGGATEGGQAPPISEPPKSGGVFAERPVTELSHKGLQDVANEFSLPDVKERDTKTDVQLRQDAREAVNDWAEKGQYVKNVGKLVEKAEGGEILTDKERVILEGHLANVTEEARQIVNKKSPEFDAKLSEIKRLKDAGEKTRSEAGAALRLPAGGSRPKDIIDFLVERMDATGVDVLTENQKGIFTKEYEDLHKARNEFNDYMAEREKSLADKQAELEFSKIKPPQQKTKKVHADFVAERKTMKEELAAARKEHEDYLKDQGIQKSGFGSLTGKEAKVIAKIVKSYAEEGITKLSEVVEKVFEEVRGVIPNIEQGDIRDVISGAYNEKKPTRNKLAETLVNLRNEQKLLNKLEALENGIEPTTEKKKIERNKELADLRKEIKDHDLTKLAQRKATIKSQIEKIEKKIKDEDFAPTEKKEPIKLDEAGHKLRDKLIKLKQQSDARTLLLQRQNEGSRERALRLSAEVANIPRTLMTIGDFSGLLRQNIFFSVGHPLMTAKATPGMFKSFVSQKVYDRWFADLENSPRYQTIKDSKLAIADSLSHDLSKREEAFMSSLAEKIPIIGSTVVKGSERSYTMLLNKMRVDVFNYLADKMEARGLTYDNSPKQYTAVAEYINNATGRSDFGEKLNRIAPILNATFFSPRLIASRVNMLTYWAQPRFWRTLPREARVDYFRNWASLLATGTTILALAKLSGADVEDDPRSSDFGKIKSGNTRWDIWGGSQSYVRVLAQLWYGQRKSTKSGKLYDLNGDDIFGETRGGVVLDFFRNKLAPVPGAAVDVLSGRTGIGDKIIYQWGGAEDKEISIDQYVKERLLPMTITGTQEAVKDRGAKALFDVGVPQIFGVGTQTYDSTPAKSNKKQKKPTKKPAKRTKKTES